MYSGIPLKSYLEERIDQLRKRSRGALKEENLLVCAGCAMSIAELEVILNHIRSKRVRKP